MGILSFATAINLPYNVGICLPEIFVANGFGVLLCLMMLFDSRWKIRGSNFERVFLKALLITVLSTCIIDTIVFYYDGRAGIFAFFSIYIGNFLEHFSTILIGPLWVLLISNHINGKVEKYQKILITSLSALGLIILLINFFCPVVFTVSSWNSSIPNVYKREPFAFLLNAIEFFFISDGIFLYAMAKKRGSSLRFFPVIQFVLPASIGAIVQAFVYGLSLIWPCLAISVTCVIVSLQSETMYRDPLTGLYNRFYLDSLMNHFVASGHSVVTAIMLDLNGFKAINDNYGHAEGDEALKIASGVLLNATSKRGVVMRYAGDEFVIVLNTIDISKVQDLINSVHGGFDTFNKTSLKKYNLSVSLGYGAFDLKKMSPDQLMNEIDSRMYQDKKRCYDGVIKAEVSD